MGTCPSPSRGPRIGLPDRGRSGRLGPSSRRGLAGAPQAEHLAGRGTVVLSTPGPSGGLVLCVCTPPLCPGASAWFDDLARVEPSLGSDGRSSHRPLDSSSSKVSGKTGWNQGMPPVPAVTQRAVTEGRSPQSVSRGKHLEPRSQGHSPADPPSERPKQLPVCWACSWGLGVHSGSGAHLSVSSENTASLPSTPVTRVSRSPYRWAHMGLLSPTHCI